MSMFSERVFEEGSCSYYEMNMSTDSTYDMLTDGLSRYEDDLKKWYRIRVSNIR